MAIVQIADFGINEEGVQTYRVHGDKKTLEYLIEEVKEAGYKFYGGKAPEIEQIVTKTYTILLKIYF